ncbi:NfeD family protein [Nocardioides sp. SOB77]|uniref:NfeD family protein n=1 Tax=Nocardioides oceani TaxID=3058369 RepID=A0ABT8FJI7_9ACTN|nr:NfeD family protein [Nocardioides oceani]MDN4174684.1 NfeD family protein [Nocardioides oceani]
MDWLGDNAWAVWLGLGVTLGVAELFSLDLILLMLAAGALVGMVAGLLSAPVVVQILVAAATSVAMLALVRPSLVKRLHTGPELKLGHSRLVGKQGVVLQEITGIAAGRVRVAEEDWTALPYDDTLTIAAGETVEVLEIRGATAYVHPVLRLES